jgi:hypothetical protein
MPGLVPGIHVFLAATLVSKTWMAGTSPAMTAIFYLFPGSEIIRLATSLFQMNSTSSAPIVAVMKPAP